MPEAQKNLHLLSELRPVRLGNMLRVSYAACCDGNLLASSVIVNDMLMG